MPYDKEYASNLANQNLISSDLKNALKGLNITTFNDKYERIDDFVINNIKNLKNISQEENSLKYAFVIDGSKYESEELANSLIKICLFNINQCVVDIDKTVAYIKEKFPLPNMYNALKEHVALGLLLPLNGLVNDKFANAKDLFRFYLYNSLNVYNPIVTDWLEKKDYRIEKNETLLETYRHLTFGLKKIDGIPHPCPVCKSSGRLLTLRTFKVKDDYVDIVSCKCDENPREIYITDLLGYHEQLNTNFETMSESTGSLTSQFMLTLEKLMMVNLIRLMEANNHSDLIEKSAFILDGTLAVYSFSQWLSEAINEEMFRIKSKENLLLISIEKTGKFVDNFVKVNNFFVEEPLKPGMLFFLNDNYIFKYINNGESDKIYGDKTYFGKKAFYKNSKGNLFVVNISYEDEHDKYVNFNTRNTNESREKVKRLDDIILILENFSSQSYSNALSLISAAHEGAALSSSTFGKQQLNKFIQEMITE